MNEGGNRERRRGRKVFELLSEDSCRTTFLSKMVHTQLASGVFKSLSLACSTKPGCDEVLQNKKVVQSPRVVATTAYSPELRHQ